MSSRQRLETISLAVLIAAVLLFYALFTRPGVTWADDWATYIHSALNLLHGSKYDVTGYIVNPETDIGPSAYPPLYPLMLVLPVAIWGVNFDAIHYAQLVGWGVFLYFAYVLTRRRLSFPLALLVAAATGFSPYFFAFKDFIGSESLFLPLLYITFVAAARFEERFPAGRLPVSAGVWLGLLITLCILTRSIGVVLAPALLIYDLLRFRRFRLASIVAVIIPSVAFPMQFLLGDFLLGYFYGLRSYFLALTDHLSGISIVSGAEIGSGSAAPGIQNAPQAVPLDVISNLASAGWHRISMVVGELSRFWGHGANGDFVARIATVVFIVLAIYGFARIWRREIMHCDIFAALYAIALLVLPPVLASARMQLPLVPLFYTYIFIAVTLLSGRRDWAKYGGIAAVVTLGTLSYLHSYKNANLRAPLDGITTTDYHEMFDYIRKQTEPNSAIIFDKPRTLALYTGRRAAAIYKTRKGDRLVSYMHEIGARYILFYDGWYDGAPREEYIEPYFDGHSAEFEMVRDSGHYVLYKKKT